MNKKIYTFFVLVFAFCCSLFADCESDKQSALHYLDLMVTNIYFISSSNQEIYSSAGYINGTSSEMASRTEAISIQSRSRSINEYCVYALGDIGNVRASVESVDCSSTNSAGMCPDLSPLLNIVSNIYDVLVVYENHFSVIAENSDLLRLTVDEINNRFYAVSHIAYQDNYINVFDSRLFNAVSNFNDNVSSSFDVLTNQVSYFNSNFDSFVLDLGASLSVLFNELLTQSNLLRRLVASIDQYLQYLQYLEVISQDISYLATNDYFNVNVVNLTNYFKVIQANVGFLPSSMLSFKGLLPNLTSSTMWSQRPFNTNVQLYNSNLADIVSGGFVNLLMSTFSLNNYFNWVKYYLETNKTDYSEITTGLANLTNILNRVDDYVLGDFSNQFYKVFENIDTLVSNSLNRVDYTTNLLEITQQLYTNNNHLASIDSKLDVLDYIKILSDTPFADYGGDVDYFDYLTNLYLNGASSAAPSTNWFERIEILLASLVFGDSDGTNGIPQSAEMDGFDTDTVSGAMSDFAFIEDFSTSIDNLDNNSRNFIQVLNDYSSAIHNVSVPSSVSIGLGGLDGQDTSNFEDLMHGHFQVSFKTGASDRFTVVVRAVTTISWILLTMIFIWHCGFWILHKIQFFYRLMRLLINSIWLRS